MFTWTNSLQKYTQWAAAENDFSSNWWIRVRYDTLHTPNECLNRAQMGTASYSLLSIKFLLIQLNTYFNIPETSSVYFASITTSVSFIPLTSFCSWSVLAALLQLASTKFGLCIKSTAMIRNIEGPNIFLCFSSTIILIWSCSRR